MTLSNAAARVRLIVWCKGCQRQVEPDPAEMAERYGAGTAVLEWRDRLVCSRCGGREIDIVVTGTGRSAGAMTVSQTARPALPEDHIGLLALHPGPDQWFRRGCTYCARHHLLPGKVACDL